jgi:DNA-binding CsgD family transcriptional regulator
MTGAAPRLRVAVAALDAAARYRLAALVVKCGHDLLETDGLPDAVLTDGSSGEILRAPAVVIGSGAGEFAGRLGSDADAVQVDAALRAVAAGLTVSAAPAPTSAFDPLPEDSAVVLTSREIEVLAALGNGLTNKETARRLGISPHTVKFHIESIFRKLGVATRAEAVAKGMQQQIVHF